MIRVEKTPKPVENLSFFNIVNPGSYPNISNYIYRALKIDLYEEILDF